MGCWDHYGHHCGGPPPPDWADVYRRYRWVMPWEPDEERNVEWDRRRRREPRRERDEVTRLETLESRARELREALERIESDIERLTARPDEEAGG
jgi:hypothetical protein